MSAVTELKKAKAYSDEGRYGMKHQIIKQMMTEDPDAFYIDSDDGKGIVGVTHKKTGFRFHMPTGKVKPGLSKEASVGDKLLKLLPAGREFVSSRKSLVDRLQSALGTHEAASAATLNPLSRMGKLKERWGGAATFDRDAPSSFRAGQPVVTYGSADKPTSMKFHSTGAGTKLNASFSGPVEAFGGEPGVALNNHVPSSLLDDYTTAIRDFLIGGEVSEAGVHALRNPLLDAVARDQSAAGRVGDAAYRQTMSQAVDAMGAVSSARRKLFLRDLPITAGIGYGAYDATQGDGRIRSWLRNAFRTEKRDMAKEAGLGDIMRRQLGKIETAVRKAPEHTSWLPYMGKGLASSAGDAFRGAGGKLSAKEGLITGGATLAGTLGLDYAGDGKIDHGIADTLVTALATTLPGARRAAKLGIERFRTNNETAKLLTTMGIRPAHAAEEAYTGLLGKLQRISGSGAGGPHADMSLKDIWSGLTKHRNEMSINFLTNAGADTKTMIKGFGDANKNLGIDTVDAGQVINPHIFSGLMEGDTPMLRRMMARQGYKRVYGESAHGATRHISKDTAESLYNYMTNKLTNRERFKDHTAVMPAWEDVKKQFHSKKIRDATGIRDERDWEAAAERAHHTAGSIYKDFDNKDLKFSRGAERYTKSPQPRQPGVILPNKPGTDHVYDPRIEGGEFDVDIRKWMGERETIKAQPLPA